MRFSEMQEVELYRGPSRRRCRELALVLHSTGVPSRHVRVGSSWVLLVSEEHEGAALRELADYDAENVVEDERPHLEWSPQAGRLEALGFAVLLAAVFAAERTGLGGADWLAAGRTDTRLGVGGNLARAVTSLTLHADLQHMLSNVLFGCLFSVLLCQAVGSGVAWLGILLSGVLGNLLSVAVSPDHTSIGASTLVFGALGLLAAYQWRVRKRARLGLKQWAPLVAGVVLLGFFGFGEDARTNYMAHATGFVAGVLLGALLGGTRPRDLAPGTQHGLLALALGLVAAAWVVTFVA